MKEVRAESDQLWDPVIRILCFLADFVYFDIFVVTSENTCIVPGIQIRNSTLPYRRNPKQEGNENKLLEMRINCLVREMVYHQRGRGGGFQLKSALMPSHL